MDYDLLARIIQAEGCDLGPVGMYAIATVIATELLVGWSDEQITEEWKSRAKPSDFARLLSKLIEGEVMPCSGYLYCRSKRDVEKLKLVTGNLVIDTPRTQFGLHLYSEPPEKDVFLAIEDSVEEAINGIE